MIYRARHARLNRWVALKVLAGGEFASADFKQRFRTEAEAAAALDHPSIVPVYEVGEAEGKSYFSMKLVEGGTLASWHSREPDEAHRRACAAAVVTLARAVHYAHERGVLHRDLKPNNVLVDHAGALFLTDFGLARLLEKESTLTRTLAVMGTPAYMAPEQARGNSRRVTTAADVYGLGAILFQLLAGRPPFMGASPADILRQVEDTEPTPPSRLAHGERSRTWDTARSDVRDLDTICLKCLEKEPGSRYESAAALAEDLQRWLRHEPILARKASTPERIRKWIRRRPAWAALIATAVTALLALGVGGAVFTLHVVRAREAAEEANARLSRNLFLREWQGAEALVAQNKTAGALMWFARALRQHPESLELSTRLLSLLSDHAFPIPRGSPITNDAAVLEIHLSPDDSQLLTTDVAGRVRCWSVASGTELFTLPRTFEHPLAGFVTRHGPILVVDRSGVSLWPAHGGAEPLREVPGQDWESVHLSRDRRRLALSPREGPAEVWDTATLQRLWIGAAEDREDPAFIRLNADGRLLLRTRNLELRVYDTATSRLVWRAQPVSPVSDWYYARGDFTGNGGPIVSTHLAGVGGRLLCVWPLDLAASSGTEPIVQQHPQVSAQAPAETSGVLVSRDPSKAFVWARSGLLTCFGLEDGKRLLEPVEYRGAIASVVESTSGRWVAAASERIVQFWEFNMATPSSRLLPTDAHLGDARFSPDGRWLAVGRSNNVTLFYTEDGHIRRVLPIPDPVRDLVISDDGRLLASSSVAGVLVWNPETGDLLSRMHPLSSYVSHLALAPDGRRYAATVPEPPQVLVFDVETGRAVLDPLAYEGSVVGTEFSPDGRRLAAATVSGQVLLWDLPEIPRSAEGTRLLRAVRRHQTGRHEGVIWMLQFSHDGTRLLTASNDRSARLWDVESGTLLAEFRHQKAVYCSQIAPNGQVILTGGGDQIAQLWNLADGRPMGEPMRHPSAVWFGQFSEDGRVVFTADDTGHARVWDARSGLPLNGWFDHGTPIRRARLGPHARYALTASLGRGVRLWQPLFPRRPAPTWFPELAETVAGARLLDDDTIEPVPSSQWDSLLAGLETRRETDFYSRWARWFLIDRQQPDPQPFRER
ncbi:MAG: protein kinase [Verrucomicrobiae bacterium]|nr:protein kinase [Verrucomicrobiae bacterium]